MKTAEEIFKRPNKKNLEDCKKEIMLRYAHPSFKELCVSLKSLPANVIESVIDDLVIMYAHAKLDEAAEKSFNTARTNHSSIEIQMSIISLKDEV